MTTSYYSDRELLPRNWSWDKALALVRPGSRCVVVDIAFPTVRARCEALGIRVGDEVTLVQRRPRSFLLERADGRLVPIERDCAWFVQVDVVPRRAMPAGGAHRHPALV